MQRAASRSSAPISRLLSFILCSVFCILCSYPAHAQYLFPGGGFAQPTPGYPGVAQPYQQYGQPYQRGALSLPAAISLAPGQSASLPFYCTDLLLPAPPVQVAYLAEQGSGRVSAPGMAPVSLLHAQQAGTVELAARPPSGSGRWLEMVLVNHSPAPVSISLPAGTEVSPPGQAAPSLSRQTVALVQALAQRGEAGSDAAAAAVWAARGSSRQDIEHMLMRPLDGRESDAVRSLLGQAGLGRSFDRDDQDYARLFQDARSAMGKPALDISGERAWLSGEQAAVHVLAGADGDGVAEVSLGGRTLHYRAHLSPDRDGSALVTLINLKTGRSPDSPWATFWLYPK